MSGGHDYTAHLEQVGRRLGRIENKVDGLGQQQAATNEHLEALNGAVERHDLKLSQLTPQVQENVTRIDGIDRRDVEDRAEAKELRNAVSDLREQSKGEQVEQDQIKRTQDFFREHWFKMLLGVTQGAIIYLLTQAIGG